MIEDRATKNARDDQAQLLLIRVILGLNPIHDPVECVRILFEDGREAFERVRGEPCEYAAQWRLNNNPFGDRSLIAAPKFPVPCAEVSGN